MTIEELVTSLVVSGSIVTIYEVRKRVKQSLAAYREEKRLISDRKDNMLVAEKERTAAILHMVNSMDALRTSLENAANISDDNLKLLAGTMKACETIAQATVDLKAEVSSFAKTVSGGATDVGYPEDNLKAPDEDKAERDAYSFAKILQGIPVHQAEREAEEMIEKKTMLSAISMDLED